MTDFTEDNTDTDDDDHEAWTETELNIINTGRNSSSRGKVGILCKTFVLACIWFQQIKLFVIHFLSLPTLSRTTWTCWILLRCSHSEIIEPGPNGLWKSVTVWQCVLQLNMKHYINCCHNFPKLREYDNNDNEGYWWRVIYHTSLWCPGPTLTEQDHVTGVTPLTPGTMVQQSESQVLCSCSCVTGMKIVMVQLSWTSIVSISQWSSAFIIRLSRVGSATS